MQTFMCSICLILLIALFFFIYLTIILLLKLGVQALHKGRTFFMDFFQCLINCLLTHFEETVYKL